MLLICLIGRFELYWIQDALFAWRVKVVRSFALIPEAGGTGQQ
jgi:hypothetical protein